MSHRIEYLTQTEVKSLLDKAKSDNYRNYVMLLLGYRHGLRCSEIINITVQNVDLDAGNIRCERKKGSVSNWQALQKDEVKAIRVWMKERPKTESPHLFTSTTGKPISRIRFFQIFQGLAQDIGLPPEKRHPHVLKHSIATHMSGAGIPVQVIQSRLGHKNISNTMVYLSVSNPFVDKAVEMATANGAVV